MDMRQREEQLAYYEDEVNSSCWKGTISLFPMQVTYCMVLNVFRDYLVLVGPR